MRPQKSAGTPLTISRAPYGALSQEELIEVGAGASAPGSRKRISGSILPPSWATLIQVHEVDQGDAP